MRIVFMGTPAFALPALQALIDSPHDVIAAYTQPPRPAGRGMKLTPSPVQLLAEKHAIEVRSPVNLKDAAAQSEFAALNADVAVVAAYGLLLPKPVLAAPARGCINIHPSDLPRWRGAAPIARTLMAGDTETACCIMRMDVGLDTGPVLARTPFAIPGVMDAGGLHDAMAKLGAELLLRVLDELAQGTARETPQAADGITYAAKLTREDRLLDWSQPANSIANRIRGLSPVPGSIAKLKGEEVKIFAVQVERGDAKKPAGEVLDNNLLINCGDGGALRLIELQRPGGKRQPAAQFQQGQAVLAGSHADSLIHSG